MLGIKNKNMEEQTIKLLNKSFMLAAILVVGVLVFFVGQMVYQSQILDQQNANQITVNGTGKIYAKPDVAMVNFGVTAEASTVAEVTKANTTKMNAVIAAVKALNVEEKDIQTTNYNLTPNYDIQPMVYSSYYPIKSTNKIIGYTLEQNIQVKIRDFEKIGDIFSKATASGANLVGDLQFTIDNPEQFKDQARAKAIAQAKGNAQNLAKESGIKLGKLINVYEGYNSYPVMYSSAKAMGAGVDSAMSPTIQPGQQEINISISLTYKVK